VGEHFARWGFPDEMVHEADWNTSVQLDDGLAIHVLTARHFSGRWLDRNRTLWASFALETPSRRIFYSGDSGYGPHFKEIGERFGGFDLVMLDSGQYNESWQYVHMMPEQSAQAAEDLNAMAALPSHAGKFSIAYHSWDDPFKRFLKASENRTYQPVTPRIGEVVRLAAEDQVFSRWWE
jgi:L-ascorbate metabolism protein UlaG (beta-lactamase superfamily)